MRKTLRNRKGVAMELAIGTALLVGALCMLLLVVIELAAIQTRKTTTRTNERFTVDRIGEEFFQSKKVGYTFNVSRYSADVYSIELTDLDEDTTRMVVYSTADVNRALLWVEVTGERESAKITRWSYRLAPPSA